jgi:integrase/recombinase XerD
MTEQAISPLRLRMIEDTTIRKFAQKTQHDYVQRVKDFASHLRCSPDTATPEDVRGFQLHLTSSGAGVPKINTTTSALRFKKPSSEATAVAGCEDDGLCRG